MAEAKMPTNALDFPGNSISNPEHSDERPPVKKITSGRVLTKKKSFGRKLADTFIGEEVMDVKTYIIQDVLVPAIKDTISDVVTGGIDMLLFGERRGKRGQQGSSYTSYSSYYGGGGSRRAVKASSNGPQTARSSRYAIEDIILESRGEAEEVLGNMIDTIKDYGMVSVADLYDMVGIPGAFTDNAWGWFDLGNATVRRVREGYLLVFPRVQSLK